MMTTPTDFRLAITLRLLDEAASQDYPAALYLIATPIGNLADITFRALECLRRMDAVAAEDTRVAKKLLSHYGVDKPCFSAHQHNERAASTQIVDRLREGQRIGFISDAGTPAISDPGVRLVRAVHEAGLRVIPIPGASAVTTALSAAGLSDGPFHFVGFLPSKRQQAQSILGALALLDAQLIFYEAPHRVSSTILLLAHVLGPSRRIVIAREITKLFETIHATTLGQALQWLKEDANRLRGEFVLIVDGIQNDDLAIQKARGLLERLLHHMPLSEAVSLAQEISGVAHKLLYAHALELKRERASSTDD